ARLEYFDEDYSLRFDALDKTEIERRHRPEPGPGNVQTDIERRFGLGRRSTSLLLDTLQLEVAVATGIVIGISGFHPHTAWKPETVVLPAAKSGCLVTRGLRLDPGISLP